MGWKETEWDGMGQKNVGAVIGQSLMIALSFEGAWVRSPTVMKISSLSPGRGFGKNSGNLSKPVKPIPL